MSADITVVKSVSSKSFYWINDMRRCTRCFCSNGSASRKHIQITLASCRNWACSFILNLLKKDGPTYNKTWYKAALDGHFYIVRSILNIYLWVIYWPYSTIVRGHTSVEFNVCFISPKHWQATADSFEYLLLFVKRNHLVWLYQLVLV